MIAVAASSQSLMLLEITDKCGQSSYNCDHNAVLVAPKTLTLTLFQNPGCIMDQA